MSDDIEKILNAPPDDFEWYLFHAERDLHLLEARLAHTANVSRALDQAFDNLLEAATLDDEPADTTATRALICRTRGFRVTEVNEQLTRLFSTLHKMHQLYKERTP